MAERQVVFVVASRDYQPIEYQVPKHLLEQSAFTVLTASDVPGTATATDGSTTQVDLLIDAFDPTEYDAIVFIGGAGSLEHLDNKKSYDVIKKAYDEKIIVAAICLSTRILAKSGILKNKKATGWNEDKELEEIYKEYGANYKLSDVVVDGKIVTAVGPAAAREFAENIISLLSDKYSK
ncbi:MAG: DJ-1/PfpI family protein [Candidatus Dependentiae bacterium]|nr:DJ-1/PfpI family protein [Candidatus Dependentiae bacterium]